MRLLVSHVDSDHSVLRMETDLAPRLIETGTNDQHPASSTLSFLSSRRFFPYFIPLK